MRSNKNPYAEGEAKAGQGSARAPFGETADRPTTGLKAKRRIAASVKSKAGAAGSPGAKKAKPKPKPKAGNPRGRTAKLLRPGVKPKRASRPAPTRKGPR